MRFMSFAQGVEREFWTKILSQQPFSDEKWYEDQSGVSEKTFGTSYVWLGPVRRTPSKKYSQISKEVLEQIKQGLLDFQ